MRQFSSAILTALAILLVIILVLALGCATTPQTSVVAHVTSLPPVSVAVPVSCVNKLPDQPTVYIDPKATVLQRYYQMRAAIDELDRFRIEAMNALTACAGAAAVEMQSTAKETK